MPNLLKGLDVLVSGLNNFFNGVISLYLIIMERRNSKKMGFFIQTNCNYEGEKHDD